TSQLPWHCLMSAEVGATRCSAGVGAAWARAPRAPRAAASGSGRALRPSSRAAFWRAATYRWAGLSSGVLAGFCFASHRAPAANRASHLRPYLYWILNVDKNQTLAPCGTIADRLVRLLGNIE